jgi:tripartite-type tricarboxylate transporter receptor subunit TctC
MQDHPQSRRTFIHEAYSAVTALLALGAGGVGAGGVSAATLSQLRILCTGPPGSIPDVLARRVAEELTGSYCQHALVENRPGAAGQIAVNALKTSPSDGSTVLLAQGAIATTYSYLYTKLAYDPVADLQPVSTVGEMTLGLAVGPAVPDNVGNIRELVDWMRRNPRLANVASPGTGTLPHLLAAMLFRAAGVEWQHVVYTGGPAALVDLMGGQIAALVLPEGLLRQHKAAGKLRVLATSGGKRSVYLPDVASFIEQGYRECVVREWFGFFMPSRVPATVVESASQAMRVAIAQPALVKAFADSAMTSVTSTPAAMATRIAEEQRYWQPIIQAAGIRAD